MDLPVDNLARPEYQQLNPRHPNQQLLNSEAGSPSDMESTSTKSPGECQSKKFNRNAAVLIEWIDEHPFNPYPTKTEKAMLAEKAGMSIRQLNDWFANARRNIKKYSYETWKKRKSGESLNKIYSDSSQKAPPNTTVGKMRSKLLVRSSSSIPSTQFPPKFSCYDTVTTECISGPITYGNTNLPPLDKSPPPLVGGIPKQMPIPQSIIVSQSASYSHLQPQFLSPTTTASSWLMAPQPRFTPPPLIRPSAWPCSCSTCRGTINGSVAPSIPQYQPMGVAPLTAFPWTQMSPPSHTPVTYYDGLSNPEIPPPDLLNSALSSPTINSKDVLGEYNKDWNGPSIEP